MTVALLAIFVFLVAEFVRDIMYTVSGFAKNMKRKCALRVTICLLRFVCWDCLLVVLFSLAIANYSDPLWWWKSSKKYVCWCLDQSIKDILLFI